MTREKENACVCVVCMRVRKSAKRRGKKRIDAESNKSRYDISRRIGTQKNTYTLGYKSLNFNEATLKEEKP